MLNNGIIEASNKQSGFSLIELMVAIVLGLLITAAVTAMTVNNLKMSGNTLKSARLNQDLGAVMQIMVNEIRRAGYGSKDFQKYLEDSSLSDIVLVDLDGESSNGAECILYRYDLNDNNDTTGDSGNHTEKRGFRITGTAIEMAIRDADDCDGSDGWESLTDPEIITITEFEIDSGNSKCHNIDEVVSVRIAPGVSATEFACNEPDEDKLQQGVVDDDGDWSWGSLTFTMDDSLKTHGSADPIYSVGVRHVNISLKGVFNDPFVEAGSDYNEYPIKKSLDVSIKVKNDHVYKYEPE